MKELENYPSFEIYKGLQKPLEFMGLQGRYIAWAAIAGISCFISFVIMFALFGTWTGIITLAAGIAFSVGLISIKQKQGLFSKKKMKGVFIINNIFSR